MIAKSDRTLIANMANCAVTTVGVGNKFNVDPQISSGPVGSIGYHGLKQTSPAIGAGDTARSSGEGCARCQPSAEQHL